MPTARHEPSPPTTTTTIVCVRVFVRACVPVIRIVHNNAHRRRAHWKHLNVMKSENSSQHWRTRRCTKTQRLRARRAPRTEAGRLSDTSDKGRRRGGSATHLGGVTSSHPLVTKERRHHGSPLKFAGRRTENAAPSCAGAEAGRCGRSSGGASGRADGSSLFLGIPQQNNEEKVASSNSCYSKMELAVAEPIRARLRRLPLLRGLEPNATALATSQDFQLTGVFRISTVIHSPVTTALFIQQKRGKKKTPADEPAGTSQMFQSSIYFQV